MDFSRTNFSLHRPLASYSKVQALVAALIRNRRWLINDSRIRNKTYLDIGCGLNTHSHFINLDYCWHTGIDVCWDLTAPLPLKSQSLQGIFSEHCLEHLPLGVADALLGECRRLLRKGGVLRLIVPDGQLYLENYAKYHAGLRHIEQPYQNNLVYKGINTPILSVNDVFRGHGHLFIYDFDMLRQLLEQHGFTEIKRESFGSGRDPALLLDTAHRAVESLYVEAAVP